MIIKASRLLEIKGHKGETVTKNEKASFKEAAQACSAVPVEAFTTELKRQIDEHFDKNAVGIDCGDYEE